eukprot:6019458-Pyramimonas_sp.AAC.1
MSRIRCNTQNEPKLQVRVFRNSAMKESSRKNPPARESARLRCLAGRGAEHMFEKPWLLDAPVTGAIAAADDNAPSRIPNWLPEA